MPLLAIVARAATAVMRTSMTAVRTSKSGAADMMLKDKSVEQEQESRDDEDEGRTALVYAMSFG